MTFIKGILDLPDGNYINVHSVVIALCSSHILTPLCKSHTVCSSIFKSGVTCQRPTPHNREELEGWEEALLEMQRAHAAVKD